MLRLSTLSSVSAAALVALATLSAAAPARAALVTDPAVTIAPSQDAFVYEDLPTTVMQQSFGGAYNGILAVANTDLSGHDLFAYVGFNLTGVTLNTDDRVTLHLYVDDGTTIGFPFQNPSAAAPALVTASAATSAWNESVTYATIPTVASTPAASVSVNGVNQWISLDITDLAKDWISGAQTNYGLVLQMPNPDAGGLVAVVTDSSAGPNPAYLQIGAVPEPASLGLLGAGMLLLIRRKK